MNQQLEPGPQKTFTRHSLAAHFLGYFFGFYLLLIVLTLLVANGDDAPQRAMMLRMARSLVARASDEVIASIDLAVASQTPDQVLRDHPSVSYLSGPDGSLGTPTFPATRRHLHLGQRDFDYELDPQKLARQLQQLLVPEGIEAIALYDEHRQRLGAYPGNGPTSGFFFVPHAPLALPLEPLQVTAEVSRSATFFPGSWRRGALIGICILLFPFVGAWLFARRVTQPLRSLEQASRELALGSLSARVPPLRKDEVGRLALSFNWMAQQLQDRDAQLRESRDRLQELNDFKSRFLANLSHELRTPLTAILGQTQMLLDELKGPLPPSARETVEKTQRNASALLSLINDLLDLSKIEAGRMDIFREDFNLRECLQEAVAAVEPQLASKSLTLEIEAPEEIWADADFVRSRQVLINLLANAVKFTVQGGVKIVLRGDGPTVVAEVTDSGIGIPAELQEVIFDEFRQADNRVSRSFEGTGLGLAIARKLALLQQGTLAVRSQLGEGSTFTYTLPAAPVDLNGET